MSAIAIITARGGSKRIPRKNIRLFLDMPKAYIDVGQAYFFEVAHFLEHEVSVDDHLGMIEVPMETAIDIDTEDDWLRAERTARLMAGG